MTILILRTTDLLGKHIVEVREPCRTFVRLAILSLRGLVVALVNFEAFCEVDISALIVKETVVALASEVNGLSVAA